MNKPIHPLLSAHANVDTIQAEEPELIPSLFAVPAVNTAKQKLKENSNSRPIDRFFRKKYIALFKVLEGGHITVIDPLGKTTLGDSKLMVYGWSIT